MSDTLNSYETGQFVIVIVFARWEEEQRLQVVLLSVFRILEHAYTMQALLEKTRYDVSEYVHDNSAASQAANEVVITSVTCLAAKRMPRTS